MNEIKQSIVNLFNIPELSRYRIAKDTGISESALKKYIDGQSDIGNMTLNNAIKLHEYYQQIKDTVPAIDDRDILFGKLLSIANAISINVFESNKLPVFITYSDRYVKAPASTFEKIHDDIMQYAYKFNDYDISLLQTFDELIGNKMTVNHFTDEPLTSKYLLAYYKQNAEIDNNFKK